MKLAIISDIHEDVLSLTKAFKKIEKLNCDEIICLGDISGFSVPHYHHLNSRNASECLMLLRENCKHIVSGNHDLYAAKRFSAFQEAFQYPDNWYQLDYYQKQNISNNKVWLYEHDELDPLYSRADLEFLSTLKETETYKIGEHNVLFSHYAYPNISGAVKAFFDEPEQFREHFKFMDDKSCALSFIGHAHTHGLSLISSDSIKYHRFNKKICLINNMCINIPSIANNNDKSGFCIFDSGSMQASAIRI